MKIAAVHCRLFPGGALEVFKDLLQQELRNDPKAEIKIFTMIADSDLKSLLIQFFNNHLFFTIWAVKVASATTKSPTKI